MNLRSTFLITLATATLSLGVAPSAHASPKSRAIVHSALAGIGMGSLVGMIDAIAPGFIPYSWILTYGLRDNMVSEFSAELNANAITHDVSVLRQTAQVADWATWIIIMVVRKAIIAQK